MSLVATENRPTFAFVVDNNLLDQLETALKSVYYHVPNAKCYVLNSDLPDRWFKRIAPQVARFGGELIDCRVDMRPFAGLMTLSQFTTTVYARFLIPKYVTESRVLYLDVDVVLTADITDWFQMDLEGHPLAAAPDIAGNSHRFNSGVMLIDADRWRAEDTPTKLVDFTLSIRDQIHFLDQEVLNRFFGEGNFRPLTPRECWMVLDTYRGLDLDAYNQIPLTPTLQIIHYAGTDKPWHYRKTARTYEIWWDYRNLEWRQIAAKWRLSPHAPLTPVRDLRPLLFNFTNVMEVEALEELLKALPDYQLVVIAYTVMGSDLIRLRSYDNLVLIENSPEMVLREMEPRMDGYLDINYGTKEERVRQWAVQAGVPIFGFDDQDNLPQAHVVPAGDVDAMAAAIRAAVPVQERKEQ